MLAHTILSSAAETGPSFALVAGLLLIGAVAAQEGLFESLGARLADARLGPRALLLALLGLVAVVTAVLNLDTSVVFLTPVLVHAARRRDLDERPFLYGSVFMANSASVLLPGSNLTNLLVLGGDRGGVAFGQRMFPAWLVACAVTAAFLVLVFPLDAHARSGGPTPPLRLGLGAGASLAAAAVILACPSPALPVLLLGLSATAAARVDPQLAWRAPTALFVLAVALGTVARLWDAPAQALDAPSAPAAAAAGAAASIVVNNLPASALVANESLAHPGALLLGLDLGPNLAVTGSLSALLWLQAARAVGARPSIVTYSRYGAVLAPLSLAAAVAVLVARVGAL
jgi:arsenical pump membrane protein